MPIEIPSIFEIQSRISADLIQSVNVGQSDTSKHIDPNIRNSFGKGIVDAMSGGFDENMDVLNQILIQIFPQTATGEFLERWASFYGINRDAATKASGSVTFEGTATTSIPSATLVQKNDGTQYATTAAGTISSQTVTISTLTRVGSTATATTASAHNLASGTTLDSISGATETEYNVTSPVITVTSATTFTYAVIGTPSTPATGSPVANFTTASINVEASDFGSAGNADSGTALNLVSPISGVTTTAYVQYTQLINGNDQETDTSLRARLQERTSNFSAPFSVSGLPPFIKEAVTGVTRVWVQDATPDTGKVTIYFTRDNDSNIIPTAAQATEVKDAIIDTETGIKPANTPDAFVIVSPPTAVSQAFTFSTLTPNTADMQTAITESLTDFFKSDTVVETDVTEAEFNNIIYSTVDSTGATPTFTLSAPSGNIVVSTGELATLGTITYP
jgi:uncharacterized phage protein gp47/JayE